MKRLYSIIAILTLSISLSNAQPSVKKYGKSVFTLTTFDKDGNIKSSDIYGVFVGSEGEAISLWTPFIDTDSAIVKTSNGDIMEVESIIGANELYNVCWFKIYSNDLDYAIESAHGVLQLPDEYLPLDNFEAEEGFFYNRNTEEVLKLSIGPDLEDFQSGKLHPQWKDFNSFLEWFFEV